MSLALQLVQRRQIGERFDAVRVEDRLAHRAAEDHELVVLLGVRDGYLRRGDRILRVGQHRSAP